MQKLKGILTDTIVEVFRYLLVIEPSLMNAMICFSIIYIIPKCTELLEKLSKVKVLETDKFLTDHLKGVLLQTDIQYRTH